jgi:CheY-like chemotaxis protein
MTSARRVILVVEDDPYIRQEIADLLGEHGFQVLLAANGAEALALLRGTRPCLVVLDLMMPVMDGWTFRAEQLKDPDVAEVPVLILSGGGNVARAAEDLGAVSYLNKPFTAELLLEAVRAHCGATAVAF